jgi:DNA-binding transcriptional ArsR family regulator
MTDVNSELLDHLGELVDELNTVSRSVRTLYSPGSGRSAWLGCEGGAELAIFLFEVRQAWAVTFDTDARDDCARDMILELAKSELAGEDISVTSLCGATSRPQTTALRKLKALVRAGLVVRQPDEKDGRRVLVALTEKTRRLMDLLYQRTVGSKATTHRTEDALN